MRYKLILFTLVFSVASTSFSQVISEKNLFRKVGGFFKEYSDLIITDDYFESSDRSTKSVVHLKIVDVEWFILSFVIYDGDLLCSGSVDKEYIHPKTFLNSGIDESSVWLYEEDENGDLRFYSLLSTEVYDSSFKLSAVLNSRFDSLIHELVGAEDETLENPVLDAHGVSVDHQMINNCADAIDRNLANLPYEQRSMLKSYAYCECITEMMLANPDLVYGALNPTSPEGELLNKACFDKYCPTCEENGIYFDDIFGGLNSHDATIIAKKGYVKGCVKVLANEASIDIGFAEMEDYCECTYDKALQQGAGFSLEDFFDPHSIIALETLATCKHLLDGFEELIYWNDKDGLMGCEYKQDIPLIYMDGAYYVKASIAGETKYLLIDSGARETIINESWANNLKTNNAFVDVAPIGYETFILADDSEVSVKKYRVKSFQVGDCTFSNFIVGVIPEGGMVLGIGFLGLFDSWEIDGANNVLILE